MATTYKQTWTIVEDGYGVVEMVFAVSDTYASLYDLAAAPEVSIFNLGSSKHDLDLAAGSQAEDEMDVTVNAAAVESTDDADAVAFVLAAQSPAVKRFCALFLEPADADLPATDEVEFAGIFRPAMTADDLTWSGTDWSSGQTPLREWKLRAQSFFSAIMDEYDLTDLIYGNADLHIPNALTTTWEAANVSDRLGYFRDGSRTAKWVAIVDLPWVVAALADNLCDALDANGLGTYDIELVVSTLDFKLTPARYSFIQISGGYIPIVFAASANNPPTPAAWYKRKSGDSHEMEFGFGANPLKSIYISYCLVKPAYLDSTPGSNPDVYSFEKNCETLTDLIYKIAISLGAFVRFEFDDPTHLTVTLLGRAGCLAHRVYIRDAASASLDVQPGEAGSGGPYYGESMGLADEGPSQAYTYNQGVYGEAFGRVRQKEGERLLLSISPTGRVFPGRIQAYGVDDWFNRILPHNFLYYDGASPYAPRNEATDTKGITTAIYQLVPGYGSDPDIEHGITALEAVIAPAGCLHANVGGEDVVFDTLAEYVNHLSGRDENYFETEYSITVPALCGFRKSADGTHADDNGGLGRWQNLVLGATYYIDADEYVVVGIERRFSSCETVIRLQDSSRFTFSTPSGLTSDDAADSTLPQPGSTDYRVVVTKTAGEAVVAGNYGCMMADARVETARAHNSQYGRGVGIFLGDAAENEPVDILFEGEYTNAAYSFTVGAPVYVRAGSPNLSTQALTAVTSTEDLYAVIGVATSATSVRLQPGFSFIFTPALI